MVGVADRLRAARTAAGYKTAKEFAVKHGIPQATYQLHESGKRGLGRQFSKKDPRETLEVYAEKLGVRPEWLRFAQGPMTAEKGKPQGENTPVDSTQQTVVPRNNPPVEWKQGARGAWEKDLPIIGNARGGEVGLFLDQGEVQGMTRRSPPLEGVTDAFAVYINDDSMFPAFEPGQVAHVHPHKPVKPDNNVVVELIDGSAFIKRLVRRTESHVICLQWNPKKEVRYEKSKVKRLYYVVGGFPEIW